MIIQLTDTFLSSGVKRVSLMTSTLVTPKCVDTLMFTPTFVFKAFIFICKSKIWTNIYCWSPNLSFAKVLWFSVFVKYVSDMWLLCLLECVQSWWLILNLFCVKFKMDTFIKNRYEAQTLTTNNIVHGYGVQIMLECEEIIWIQKH